MGFWTFLVCVLIFYVGYGGRILSGLERGDFDDEIKKGNDGNSTKGELKELWETDKEEALLMIGMCLFAWPVVLVIIND